MDRSFSAASITQKVIQTEPGISLVLVPETCGSTVQSSWSEFGFHRRLLSNWWFIIQTWGVLRRTEKQTEQLLHVFINATFYHFAGVSIHVLAE
ncbi:hypothetical protein F7725_001150 [Dissostichus mawsoni]|uniref:Uncharacterized protein n=1 Tax=Dissostichus mawsoni TaxID=36200 RepID=A0A7J5ZGG5_DISMA|nr:hypothetical protein F7725_001150 [Dissostichus mawsoni]